MTHSITLFCNGCADACPNSYVANGNNLNEARSGARQCGWRHTPRNSLDYCPRCVAERRAPSIRSRECRLCQEHPDLDFRSLIGHDAVGHRTANALCRFGVRSLEQLRRYPERTLRSIPGLGEAAIRRITSILDIHAPGAQREK